MTAMNSTFRVIKYRKIVPNILKHKMIVSTLILILFEKEISLNSCIC
jgi:hypothetical protein